MKYRLTKIAIPETISAKSASSIEEYRANMSRADGFSPPIEYYIEGIPDRPPLKGTYFSMLRDNRNGVKVLGVFRSSPIVDVDEGEDFTLFSTLNSVYKLEKLVDK